MGGVGGDVGKCVGVWGEVRKDVWGGCRKVYGVSGEVCWRMGKGCGEGNGEDVGKCVEVWGPNTLLIRHISLPSPFPTSPLTSPTPHHTFQHLLSYLFPHPPFLPHTPTHFPTIPTSPFTFKCAEVTMRRSFCGEVTGNPAYHTKMGESCQALFPMAQQVRPWLHQSMIKRISHNIPVID